MLFVGAGGTTLASAAQVRPIVHLVWVLPVLIWAMRTRTSLPPRVTLAVTGVLIAYGVASLGSRNAWMSLETAGFAAAAAALFIVAAGMSAATRTYVARAVVMAVTVWLAALAVVWASDTVVWISEAGWPAPGEPIRSYVWLAGNSIPVLALLSLPFIRWLGADAADRWLARLLVITAIPAVLLSGGVIGIAGVATAVGTHIALNAIRSRRQLFIAACIAGVLVAAAGVVLTVGPHVSLPATAEARLTVWEQGARMLGSDVLTGTGPGTTALIRREFVEPHGAAVLTDHLHSVPVQAAAEGGVLLLAALVVAVAAWGSSLWASREGQPDGGRLLIACLTGVGVTFLGDSFLDLPVVVALLVTVAAWGMPVEAGRHRTGLTSAPGVLRVSIATLALMSVGAVISADGARLMAVSGRSEARAGNWSAALQHFESAVAWNPANPLYRLEAGAAARSLGLSELARQHFSESTAMAPADGRAWGALASVTTDPAEKIGLLTTASERADGDPQFAFRLGMAWEEAGRLDEAIRAYAEAVALQPDLIALLPDIEGVGVSRSEVARQLPAMLDALSKIAGIDPLAIGWDLQLLEGRLDEDAADEWQAVDAARDGDYAAADAHLAAARDRSPTSALTWQAAAAVARLRCSVAETERMLRLERLLVGSHRFRSDGALRSWERMYREPSLGDFQPPDLVPRDAQWPAPFVDLGASCR